jgi:hypothetical protein
MKRSLTQCPCCPTFNGEIQENFQFPNHQDAVEFISSPDREPGLWGIYVKSYVEKRHKDVKKRIITDNTDIK